MMVDGFILPAVVLAENQAIDADITKLQPGAGIRWWLEAVRARYGPWTPPQKLLSQVTPCRL